MEQRVAKMTEKLIKEKAKLEKLKENITKYQDEDGCVVVNYDNWFEYLLFLYPIQVRGELNSFKNFKIKWLEDQKITDPMFKSILDMFPAASVKEQRQALRQFLDEHEECKTTDLQKMRQRIYLILNYPIELLDEENFPEFSQNPIRTLIEDNPVIPLETIPIVISERATKLTREYKAIENPPPLD